MLFSQLPLHPPQPLRRKVPDLDIDLFRGQMKKKGMECKATRRQVPHRKTPLLFYRQYIQPICSQLLSECSSEVGQHGMHKCVSTLGFLLSLKPHLVVAFTSHQRKCFFYSPRECAGQVKGCGCVYVNRHGFVCDSRDDHMS